MSVCVCALQRSNDFYCIRLLMFMQGSYPPASIYGTLRVEDLWAFCGKIFGVANMLPDVNDTNAYYGYLLMVFVVLTLSGGTS